MELAAAWKAARASLPDPGREMELAHRQALARHDQESRRYRRRVERLRSRMTAGIVGAGTGLVVFAAAIPGDLEWWGWAGLGMSAVTAWSGLDARRAVRELAPPKAPSVPLPPPPPLPPNARGATEAARLGALRIQLSGVVPTVERLHPGAGAELRAADAEAAPALAALVDRLAVLHRIEHDMPATTAAAAAGSAAEEVRQRLAAGAATYERLLAAAAALLAAPDLNRGAEEVLAPAVEALSAYADGLGRSAAAFEDR